MNAFSPGKTNWGKTNRGKNGTAQKNSFPKRMPPKFFSRKSPTFSRKMPPKNKVIDSGSPKSAFFPGGKRVHMIFRIWQYFGQVKNAKKIHILPYCWKKIWGGCGTPFYQIRCTLSETSAPRSKRSDRMIVLLRGMLAFRKKIGTYGKIGNRLLSYYL